MKTASVKKTAYIRTRIRPHIKEGAERIFDQLGMSTTDAISVFLSQVSMQGGLPFDVKVPNEETRKALREDVSKAQRYDSVEKMFNDILGRNWKKRKA